jgi:hypothetical protein
LSRLLKIGPIALLDVSPKCDQVPLEEYLYRPIRNELIQLGERSQDRADLIGSRVATCLNAMLFYQIAAVAARLACVGVGRGRYD